MTDATLYLVVMLLIFVVFVWPAWRSFRREEQEARKALAEAREAGRHEPVSIRPYVNLDKCMGSGACISACPEKKILQVIDGQARLVNASYCVGHGACESACPVGAIELVFGSERRGVDIPRVEQSFASNVPGLYIAGELGGMGLIANAVDQGVQAVGNLMKGLPKSADNDVDLLIVGAGPAGLGAALEAKQRKLNFLLVEQEEFGGAIRHYPRQKLVMSRGFCLPGFEPVPAGDLSKEDLIEIFEKAVQSNGLEISERERVDAVEERAEGGFAITTSKRSIRAARVLLAIGRRGTPRQLQVPGEDQQKVAYRLLDPELYTHSHILVVGGGDSAIEAACSLAEQEDNRVTLSYRKEHITRPKPANQERLKRMAADGQLHLMLPSTVRKIGVDRVHLQQNGEDAVLPNDYVFVFAGGVLPTGFLNKCGVRMERHFGKHVQELQQ